MDTSTDHGKSTGDGARQSPAPFGRAFRGTCVIQVLIAIVLLLGDIGFDKPGRFGLDFGHLLILLLVYAILILWALSLAIRARSWFFVRVQVLLLAAMALGLVL